MANRWYPLGSVDAQPVGGTGFRGYCIADADASKPSDGLLEGNFCWAADTDYFYVWNGSSWSRIGRLDEAQDWSDAQVFDVGVTFNDVTLFNDIIQLVGTGGVIRWIRNGLFRTLDAPATFSGGSAVWTLPLHHGNVVVAGGASDPAVSGHIAAVNKTAQSAAIASAILANDTPAGLYRISFYLRCTVGGTGTGFVGFDITYTDAVGATTQSSNSVQLNSTANYAQGSFVAYLASGDITYAVPLLSGTIGTSRYELRARCEFLG